MSLKLKSKNYRLPKTKLKVATLLLKKALEIPPGYRKVMAFPIPTIDIYAGKFARGQLDLPFSTLRRIIYDAGLDPHSLLGVNFVTRNFEEPLSGLRISNIFEPISVILGPPELAGESLVSIINKIRKGILSPEDVKVLGLKFNRSLLSAIGIPAPISIVDTKTGLPLSPEASLEEMIRISTRQVPLEVASLVNPFALPNFKLTKRHIDELVRRYRLLQRYRRQMNLPLADEIPGLDELSPVERFYKILTSGFS